MKCWSIISVILLLVVLVPTMGLAQDQEESKNWENVVAFDGFVLYGWVQRNESGEITSVSGVTITLGYGVKNYFEPLKLNDMNPYWGWSVGLLILGGYVGVGVDYVTDKGFYVGGWLGVGVFYLIPWPYGSIDFGIYF